MTRDVGIAVIADTHGLLPQRVSVTLDFAAYRVTDALSAKVTAKLVVKWVHTKKTKSYDLGLRPTGRRLTTAVKCDLGVGTWAWRVQARDQAGNMGYGPWRHLVVRR